jgi:hypothetical protein
VDKKALRKSEPLEKDKKQRAKKARGALADFLERLKKGCETLDSVEQWYQVATDLEELLDEYTDVISPKIRTTLEKASRVVDPTKTGLEKACGELNGKLAESIPRIGGATVAQVLTGGLIAVAAATAVFVGYMNATATQLAIENRACAPFSFGAQVPFADWVGFQFPEKPIPTNGSDTAKIPRLVAVIDATQPGRISVSVLGATYPIPVARTLQDATLDEIALLGQYHRVDFGSQDKHTLILTCHAS